MLCIDRTKVRSPIRDENLEGGDSVFPHIYGALNLDSVVEVFGFSPTADGDFELPVALTSDKRFNPDIDDDGPV